MEGDAGTSRLNPRPVDDEPERSEGEELANSVPVDDEPERSEGEESDSLDTEGDDASRAEAPDGEASVETVDVGAGAQRSRLYSRGWVVGVCASLVLFAALISVGGYLALRSNAESRAMTRAESAALQAAKDCVIATQAPDLASMSASQQKIVDCSTGDFGAQAALYSGVLVDAYKAANAQVKVSDMRAAVEKHNGDGSMDVLVALRVKVTNSATQEQESGYRLRVTMASDGGVYKIAKLDQVTT